MNLIVNTRYNERRLTIFTSNYEDIPDDTDPNSLLFRIGFRMRSRLHEMCEFVEMDGADYRELPANGGVDDLITLWKTRAKTLPARAARQARAQLREPPSATAGPTSSGRADGRDRWQSCCIANCQLRAAMRQAISSSHSNLQCSASTSTSRSARPSATTATSTAVCSTPALKTRYVDALRCGDRRGGGQTGRQGGEADTIFFGGGTPSLLEPGEIARIIDACRAGVRRRRRRGDHARGESRNGATERAGRLSRGGRQSSQLRCPVVSRRRAAAAVAAAQRRPGARRRCREARAAGFDNVSLDLMMWLPGQRVDEWLESVDEAIALGPEHLSLYLLEVYPNAPLKDEMARARWSQAPDDDAAAMYLTAMERLEAAGYEQYEISNVARPGRSRATT